MSLTIDDSVFKGFSLIPLLYHFVKDIDPKTKFDSTKKPEWHKASNFLFEYFCLTISTVLWFTIGFKVCIHFD